MTKHLIGLTMVFALLASACGDDGVWHEGTCATENLVGICDRSERYGLVRYYYASELTTAASARQSCDEGVFRPAVPN